MDGYDITWRVIVMKEDIYESRRYKQHLNYEHSNSLSHRYCHHYYYHRLAQTQIAFDAHS